MLTGKQLELLTEKKIYVISENPWHIACTLDGEEVRGIMAEFIVNWLLKETVKETRTITYPYIEEK